MNQIPLVAKLTNVSIDNPSGPILKDVNCSIAEAELCYLIGKTGSGKSTLLKLLYGENELTTGRAEIAGTNLSTLTPANIHLYRRKLGMVFQDFALFPEWSVFDNLSYVLKATDWTNKKEIQNRVEEVLTAVQLDTERSRLSAKLSGGEQQRLAIARAILNKPELLIADEPTGNLDPESADEILNLIRRLTLENNMASIVATHDHSLLQRFPARVLRCEGGTIV